MIIIRLKGGRGNQMFQYAFGKAMATKLDTQLKIDCTLLLDRARGPDRIYRDYDLSIFNIDEQFTIRPDMLRSIYRIRSSKIGKGLRTWVARGKHYEKEKHFHTDRELLSNPIDHTVYEGWWQSGLYFESIREILKKEFTYKQPLLPASKEIYHNITNSNAICLNVRRTDFLTNPVLNATNLDYFMRSAAKMAALVKDPNFFVFSDDIPWCEENIRFPHPVTIVRHDVKGEKFGNYLRLMQACKHFIIPNSSFAWWAVWLNEHANKQVIAPKNWFNEGDYDTSDLVPTGWIRL